jgi:geranylgeranyl pyrophosphate synthase
MSARVRRAIAPLADLVDAELLELLDGDGAAVSPELWERALFGPARDLLARGGKSLRARLVETGWRVGGGAGAGPPLLAMALEVLHAGSLVVDDIEDDSTYRRGEPALHRRYGLPRALNCGNWMSFWPTLLLERLDLPPAVELELRRAFGRAVMRCHHGQALDLTVRAHETARAELPELVATITRLKTGALTELALTAGAIAAGAPPPTVAALGAFGAAAGTALQMLDDVGSLAGARDPEKRYEDLRLGRATWPWAWLAVDLAEPFHRDLARMAAQVVIAGEDPGPLAALMLRLLDGRGRERALERLLSAHDELRRALGPAAELCTGIVRRLEESYA